ncbi:phage terminase large subunit [Brachyspira hyodysenteriae]|nr:phage terminase large subunit [Brachyspira hyodysenteriae]MDA0063042.1 phage terminase large subunit [Brachyspira hyodysenteriae]MDA0096373.1 phage terminase large subunit [Brachyspira hyodysenteriae]
MANNKTQDKYHIPFMIEKFKEYVNKKHSKYPTFEQLYFENNWVRQNVHKILKSEAGKEITEETLTFWYTKLKEKQKKMLFEKIYLNKSVQGLIFLAKYCHGIGIDKENEESGGATELDYKLELLRHDIELFFQLARKENIDPAKKFVHLEGGRAGGKSEQVARYVILKALERKTNGSLLCGREVQKSIETSVKPLLERIIKLYHLENYFNITKQEILSKHNNVRIIFMGLKEASSDASDTLKSTDLLFLAWIEEAQSISELSLEKLIPTAARVEDYQIIFTYNRHRQNTVIYDYFFNENVTRERLILTQHININYYDNKFNSHELISLAELDKATNLKKWKYIWNGEPQTEFDGALWTYEEIKDLNLNLPYDKDNYVRRIVATDPATSSKDFNNEYGITVLGINHEGYVHLIADVSGHYTASEYAKVLVKTYFNYECEAVVYEENQGGDHVANTILSESKSVRLIPVRATQSKYLRALPVANLCSQGKVYFLKSFPKLENQMLLLTIQGYQGEQGESPDRLGQLCMGRL